MGEFAFEVVEADGFDEIDRDLAALEELAQPELTNTL